MLLSEKQHSELEKMVSPVISWLNDNCHPHTTIIVDNRNAELLEGIASVGTSINRDESNSDVEAQVSDDMAETKQGFYVKAKIQSKVDLKCVFITDHLVHLGDLPINQIEHAVYDEIAKRIKDREEDKYEILAIEKIIVALDNPPEMS